MEAGADRLVRVPDRVPPVAGVLLAALAALLPAWRASWYQDDQLPSVFRTLHTYLAHQQGILFPRMAFDLGSGYGQLLHQVYPPLGFELTAWMHALGLGYIASVRAFFSLCLVGGAFGAYAYGLAILRGRAGAVLAAIGYVWAPYVLLDAHPGGDFGESLAIALLPWSLLAFRALATSGGWATLAASVVGLAAVNLAHNITALFFTGLVCLYLGGLVLQRAVQAGRGAALGLTVRSAVAVVLALALSAVYWLPALAEIGYSRIGEQRQGMFSVSRYLVPPDGVIQGQVIASYDLAEQHRFGLVQFGLTIGALLLLGMAIRARQRRCRVGRSASEAGPELLVLAGFAIVFIVVLALQLRPSQLIWDTVPLISFVQFPRRLYVFATLASVFLVGSLPWALGQLGLRNGARLAVGGGIVAALGLAGLPGIYGPAPVPSWHALTEDQVTIGSPADRRFSQRSAYDDFFPAWVTERQVDVPRPPTHPDLYRVASDLPAPNLQIEEYGYREIRFVADAETVAGVVLHRFYFPGWRAVVDGQPTTAEPVGPLGLTRVSVPPGHHEVVVTFGDTLLRTVSSMVSIGACLLVIVMFGRGLGIRRTFVGLAAIVLTMMLPWDHTMAAAATARPSIAPLDAALSPSARIVGIELQHETVAPGDTLDVTVFWQATAWTAADLQSGLRLVPLDGETPLAERWDRPNLGRTPTAKWVLGELVPDAFSLRVPPDTPPGRYRLLAGLRGDGDPSLQPVGEVTVR